MGSNHSVTRIDTLIYRLNREDIVIWSGLMLMRVAYVPIGPEVYNHGQDYE